MAERLRTAKVPFGQLFITANAKAELDQLDVLRALDKHATGDWGEVSPEDWQLNDRAVVEGTRILSAYWDRNRNRFWIITEADRSVTTVLLPSDY